MIAYKRNKERIPGGKATAGSGFTYNLSAKYSLLVNEITGLNTKTVDTPLGSIEVVIDEPPRHISQSRLRPKSVRIFSILEFNNQKTYAG